MTMFNPPYKEEFEDVLKKVLIDSDLVATDSSEAVAALVVKTMESSGIKLARGCWPGYRIGASGPLANK